MKKLYLLFAFFYWAATANAQIADPYDVSFVHDIRINIEQPKNWSDILDSMRIYGDGMLIATVMIDGTTFQNVGINYKGGTGYTTGAKRNPLQIKLNYIDKNQNYQGIKTFRLSQALRDPSMVREVLGYEIARKYLPTPRANYTNLTINGEQRGLFVNVEAISEEFLQRNFGAADGSLFRANPEAKTAENDCSYKIGNLKYEINVNCFMKGFEMTSKTGWDDLLLLSKVVNSVDYEAINKNLNVDRTLWLLAVNNVLVNLYSYSGDGSSNYYLYKDKKGQFNMILGDMNFAFGSLKNIGDGKNDLDLTALQELDPLLHANSSYKPLLANLLQNSEYKKIYLAHIRQILSDFFENDQYLKRAADLQKIILPHFETDKFKTYTVEQLNKSLNTTVGERTKIPGIAELMSKRTKFLKRHPELAVVPPTITEITVSNRQRYSNQPVSEFKVKAKIDKFPKRVRLMYRSNPNDSFKEITMLDDGKSHDGEIGDKYFGCAINPQGKFDTIEYYIVAENSGAINFEPLNYMFELRKVSLAELNK